MDYNVYFVENMEAYGVDLTEWIAHKIFFWEHDLVRKGKLLRAVHHFFSHVLVVLIVVSHTLYPSFLLQSILLFLCTLVWISHILTNGCTISKVEQKWIGDSTSFVDPFLELFHIEPTQQLSIAFLVWTSSLVVLMLSLEWVSNLHRMVLPVLVSVVQQNGIIYTEG